MKDKKVKYDVLLVIYTKISQKIIPEITAILDNATNDILHYVNPITQEEALGWDLSFQMYFFEKLFEGLFNHYMLTKREVITDKQILEAFYMSLSRIKESIDKTYKTLKNKSANEPMVH